MAEGIEKEVSTLVEENQILRELLSEKNVPNNMKEKNRDLKEENLSLRENIEDLSSALQGTKRLNDTLVLENSVFQILKYAFFSPEELNRAAIKKPELYDIIETSEDNLMVNHPNFSYGSVRSTILEFSGHEMETVSKILSKNFDLFEAVKQGCVFWYCFFVAKSLSSITLERRVKIIENIDFYDSATSLDQNEKNIASMLTFPPFHALYIYKVFTWEAYKIIAGLVDVYKIPKIFNSSHVNVKCLFGDNWDKFKDIFYKSMLADEEISFCVDNIILPTESLDILGSVPRYALASNIVLLCKIFENNNIENPEQYKKLDTYTETIEKKIIKVTNKNNCNQEFSVSASQTFYTVASLLNGSADMETTFQTLFQIMYTFDEKMAVEYVGKWNLGTLNIIEDFLNAMKNNLEDFGDHILANFSTKYTSDDVISKQNNG